MSENGTRYTRSEAPLIAALAGGATVKEAATLTRLSERTVKRRLGNPTFKKAIDAEKAAMVSRATAMLADASTEAVMTLRRLLGAASEPVRLGAARSILELGSKLRESEELAERVARLEEQARNVQEVNGWTA